MSSENLFTGKTVDDAIAEGLRTLGLAPDQAEIEIISRGSRGLFGIGSEPAQVRITRRSPAKAAPPPPEPAAIPPAPQVAPEAPPAPAVTGLPVGEPAAEAETGEEAAAGAGSPEDEAMLADMAEELLGEMVRLMGFEAEVVADWRDPDADNEHRYLRLNLEGRDLSPLIGRRGDTLNNIQYLVRLMVNQRLHQWKNIVVDVDGYRQRRVEHLTQLALRSAEQVAESGRAFALEPMSPNERRIVHLALRDHPDVYTESSGEGDRRKVHIYPKRD